MRENKVQRRVYGRKEKIYQKSRRNCIIRIFEFIIVSRRLS